MAKEILCGFGVGVDAVAGWLSSYGGEDSPSDISRGMFAGEVGTPRLLNLFDQFNIPTTWFMPGHSIETFPRQMEAVVNAGHEIGFIITVMKTQYLCRLTKKEKSFKRALIWSQN